MSERTGLGKTHSEEAARALLERMPAFRHLGFRVIRAASDAFEVCVPFATEISYAPRSFPASIVGAIADFAAGAACASAREPGARIATIAYSMNMLAPAIGESLIARGRALSTGRVVSVGAADVFVVDDGREILCATATVTMRS